MTIILIFGIIFLLLGAMFYWLNVSTPFQTFLPAIFVPAGLAALMFALGGMLQ